jgi:type IV secretion system protein VirD4
MRTRIALCAGAILVAIGAWTVMASRLFVWIAGLSGYFPSPWTTWWRYVQHPMAGRTTLPYLVVSGIGAALPLIAFGVLVYKAGGNRKKLTPPSGGGVHPIEPGVTDNHGHATILTDKEALRRFPGPMGVVVGETRDGKPGLCPLVIDPVTTGAGHGMLVAGTRAGKTSSAVTQALYWPGSEVVLDPSAEMGSMLKDALEGEGKRVFMLNPDTPGVGFNALDWIDPAAPLAGQALKEVVSWVFPESASNVKTDDYFGPTGRALCLAILADLVWSERPAAEKTLSTFRKLIVTPEKHMPKLLAGIHARSNSPMAREVAGTLMAITPKQWSGVYGAATTGTEWLSEPSLAGLISGNSFSTADILDGSTVVFAQVPLHSLDQSPGVGRVIIGALMYAIYNAAAKGKAGGKVLVQLDEAWVLGPMKIQKSALVAGAKSGIVLNFLYQSVGQVREIWGDNGITTLYNNLEYRAYAATKDFKTADEISQDIGEIGVLAYSEGTNSGTQRPAGLGWGSRSSGDNLSVHEIKRRRVLPQEIKDAPRDEVFVIAGDCNMRLRMPVYYLRPDLQSVVHPSHYYQPQGLVERVDPGQSPSPVHRHSRPYRTSLATR